MIKFTLRILFFFDLVVYDECDFGQGKKDFLLNNLNTNNLNISTPGSIIIKNI